MTTLPDTMSGVQLTGHGGPEKLVWRDDIPAPRPGPGQVLVRVLAAGVNNTDINTRVGWYAREVTSATDAAGDAEVEAGGWSGALGFPLIQGADLCGEVVALGPGAEGPSVGARVTCPTNQPEPTAEEPTRFRAIGSELDGAFAEYCVVPAEQLFDVTGSPLTDTEIGAMPCAFGTAFNMLERAGIKEGEHVLITGASGGVGLAAVALAALRGARVTAQCSAAKADAVRDAGAAEILDRSATPPPKSFHAWIDVVGGEQWPALLRSLRAGGRLATSGAIAGPIVKADLREIYLNDLTLLGCTYQSRETFRRLVNLINAGAIHPLISKTYPLKEIRAAQEDFASKRYPGKLVLIP